MNAAQQQARADTEAKLWKPERAANYLQMDVWFIYRHAHEMGGVKIGNRLRFNPEDVVAFGKGQRKK